MKKVLFVAGLALCTTMAMAQTTKGSRVIKDTRAKVNFTLPEDQPVDYKGSIFTKDDDVVVATFNFASGSMTGIKYGASAAIKSGETINVNGVDSAFTSATEHGRSEANTYWTRIENVEAIQGTDFNTTYPNSLQYGAQQIPNYMGSQNSIEDNNGFMFISLIEYFQNTGKGNVNAYFELPAVDLPAGTKVLDIDWRQFHRKFYENCFVDYKKGNKWYAVEVNVTNVDVNVNATSSAHYILTLPPAACDQASLAIRFRVSSSDASQVYGYMWAVDNVRFIVPASSTRWSFTQPGYLDGFIGTIPQGFNIPLGYVLYAHNRGAENLTNTALAVNHVETGDEVLSVSQANLPAGDPSAQTLFKINERGFMTGTAGLDATSAGYQSIVTYWENFANYGNSASDFPSQYKLRGLPTATAGKNTFAVVATNAQGLTSPIDTMAYYVSPLQDAYPAMGRTVEGYRWANDNGVVPSGSEFAYQLTDDGYVTDDNELSHHYEVDYECFTRFNSPSVIPTDEKGQPWVIRGLEYVTATTLTSSDIDGAKISPLAMYMDANSAGDPAFFLVQGTGVAEDQVFTIDGNVSAPEDVEYGVAAPGQPYYAYNILFPGQPEIIPNISYFFGYTNQGGTFAVAGTQNAYLVSADSAARYSSNPAVADYYHQFTPVFKVHDAYVYDPLLSRAVTGWNISRYPMIRAIVGPKLNIPTYEISLKCDDDTSYWLTTGANRSMCGFNDTVAEGSSMSYYVIPGIVEEMDEASGIFGHMVIDQILVDGNPIDLNDPNIVTPTPYNVVDPEHGEDSADPWPPLLERNYYRVTLRDIKGNHTISAKASYRQLSVREAEDNVRLTLAPNPATSQVRLNVSGMTGMVSCSIIDMSGREVLSTSFNAGSEQTISLNDVPAGTYFVRITNDSFSKVEKLIVR